MPSSSLPVGSPEGDGTTDHALPLQCSIRLCVLVDVVSLPTAQMLVADSTATACNLVSSEAGSDAEVATDQRVRQGNERSRLVTRSALRRETGVRM